MVERKLASRSGSSPETVEPYSYKGVMKFFKSSFFMLLTSARGYVKNLALRKNQIISRPTVQGAN